MGLTQSADRLNKVKGWERKIISPSFCSGLPWRLSGKEPAWETYRQRSLVGYRPWGQTVRHSLANKQTTKKPSWLTVFLYLGCWLAFFCLQTWTQNETHTTGSLNSQPGLKLTSSVLLLRTLDSVCVYVSHSVMYDSLWSRGLQSTKLLYPWDSPGRTLEWVAIPFSRATSWLRNQTWVFCITGRFFIIWATSEAPGLRLGLNQLS